MDTEANPHTRRSDGNPVVMFITSISAAIVVAGGFGIIIEAFIVASADLFQLGRTVIMVASAFVVLLTLWLFVWCFARSYHVERRLGAGLDIDVPQLSILANFRNLGPVPAKS
jgi:hypothetical protein